MSNPAVISSYKYPRLSKVLWLILNILLVPLLINELNKILDMCSFYIFTVFIILPFWKLYFGPEFCPTTYLSQSPLKEMRLPQFIPRLSSTFISLSPTAFSYRGWGRLSLPKARGLLMAREKSRRMVTGKHSTAPALSSEPQEWAERWPNFVHPSLLSIIVFIFTIK